MKATTKIILNSIIAGALVFIGAASAELQDHGFNEPQELLLGVCLGFGAGLIIFLTKMQTFLTSDKKGEVHLLEFV